MTDFSSGWSTLISAEKTACYHISRGGPVMQKLWERHGSYLPGPGVWWSPGAAPPGWRRSAGCGERWTSSVCRNQSGLAWKDRKHWEIKSNHFYCHIKCLSEWNSWERAPDSAKKQFTYRQYILTDCTEDNVQNTQTYTQYTQCTIKTYLVINTHYTHSTLCTHLYIVICEGARDSCAKVQQIMHMQCRGCALHGVQW